MRVTHWRVYFCTSLATAASAAAASALRDEHCRHGAIAVVVVLADELDAEDD